MKIELSSISLLNFKGIKNLTVNFNDVTNIKGANKAGKTTVFDGFFWLLFGKDSKGNTDFSIKTLDSNNLVIERLPHEVCACLMIDGVKYDLKRCYKENWVQKRGSTEVELTGHSTECFWNDVPVSVTEYKKRIDSLIPEDIFRKITSRDAFMSLKPEEMRKTLVAVAGEISDVEIAGSTPEFLEILALNKPFEDIKKELSAKRAKYNERLKAIKEHIEERSRNLYENVDFDALANEKSQLTAEIAKIDAQISDALAPIHEAAKRNSNLTLEVSNLESRKIQLIADAKNTVIRRIAELKSENERILAEAQAKAAAQIREANADREKVIDNIASIRRSVVSKERELADVKLYISALEAKLQTERNNYLAADAKVFVFRIGACSHCGQILPDAVTEAQALELFNEHKEASLNEIKANAAKIKADIAAQEANEAALKATISELTESLASITVPEEAAPPVIVPEAYTFNKYDIERLEAAPPIVEQDIAEIATINARIAEIKAEISNEIQTADTQPLKDRKAEITAQIEDVTKKLAVKAVMEQDKERIKQLKAEESTISEEFAELERILYNLAQFEKARMEVVQTRIDSLFSFVKFKMFETQLNGGEKETCIPLINGVPFKDANYASQVNAGLDVINALSTYYGYSAPVFIDNRESITEILPINSQIINLIVSPEHKVLTIN